MMGMVGLSQSHYIVVDRVSYVCACENWEVVFESVRKYKNEVFFSVMTVSFTVNK